MDTPLRDRPVFICGHPKSGTSLLRALLDSHPQLVVYPEETVFFREFLPQSDGLDLEGLRALALQRLIHIFEWNQTSPPPHQRGFPDRDYSHVDHQAIARTLEGHITPDQVRHPGDILSGAVLAYGQVTGLLSERTARWVEKSPYNEYYTDQIFAWWPQARCVHIVRDPRDNYLSYRRKHPEWSAEAFAANWARSTSAGQENTLGYGAHRYRLITYEQLVSEPEMTLTDLGDFLGIDPDDNLAVPTRAGQPWAGNSMFALEFQGISTATLGRWRSGLSPAEAGVIALIAGPAMSALGYEPTPGAFIRSRLRLAKWQLHRLIRSAQG